MNTDCAAFERWLDEGLPGAGEARAFAHAGSCPRCASLLELERALATPARATTTDDFSAAVMHRIAAGPAPAPARHPSLMFPTPVWVQALLDPLVALTLTALVLAVAGRDALWSMGATFAARFGSLQWPSLALPGGPEMASVSHALAGLSATPAMAASTVIAIAPALLLVSWALFRWADRWLVGSVGAGLARERRAFTAAR